MVKNSQSETKIPAGFLREKTDGKEILYAAAASGSKRWHAVAGSRMPWQVIPNQTNPIQSKTKPYQTNPHQTRGVYTVSDDTVCRSGVRPTPPAEHKTDR